ncbi:MAG: SDR family oxidoreductase, partial [Anaerolineae bacterium]|nr:SDR family oxidoreductase [Anaerolineae bacterium]
LSDYNTLAKVVGFMQEALQGGMPAPAPAVETAPAPIITAQPTQAAPAAQAQPVPADSEDVKAFVLAAVSEKTGYPVEMLDLELDLEADLGVDTVKQAELFAAIRTHYNIPRREDLRLSDYNTLAKVVSFMQEALQGGTPAAAAVAASSSAPVVEAPEHLRSGDLADAIPQQNISRRVPVPVLRPRLELCLPTDVAIDTSSRILIIADRGKVAQALAKRLRGRKAAVQVLADAAPEQLSAQTADFTAQGAVQGVYFLPALDPEPALAEMSAETWCAELERRAHALYAVMSALPNQPFLVCATRMGGLHGLGADGAGNPIGGAVSGFAKALAMERAQSLVKVVDFEPAAQPAAVAASLVEETLSDPGVVEVGWRDHLRFGFTLDEAPAGADAFELTAETVYLISGGSGGITAPVVLDLASRHGGTFYLLSRTPLPAADDPDIRQLRADRDAYKAEMGRRLREKGEKATPAVVDKLIAGLERALATQLMMTAAQKAGASVHYLVCDVADPASVAAAIEQVVAQSGRVDVFLHAAGQDRSHKLSDKSVDEFRGVLTVKADGFFNIFKALESRAQTPRAVVFFSSLAGRFGNSGQTDYAAGNDLLNKLAASLPRQYPDLKAIALDWGAWAEVGMASRGYIPELMQRAGIEMLHPANAAPLVSRELCAAAPGSEIVLAGALGMLEMQRQSLGGLDLEKANRALRAGKPIHTMLTNATGYNSDEGIILQADLDPEQEPFLRDHTLNGIPLLPGVMGIEGLSTAARHIASVLASHKGSFRVSGLDDIQFLAAFKFYRNQPRRVTWKARVERDGDRLLARASLESTLTRYGRDPQRMLHFTATVHLQPADEPLEACSAPPPHWNGAKKLTAKEIYKLYFHGPSFQVLEAVQQDEQQVLGKLRRNLPPLTTEEREFSTSPALVELCLQTAGIWEIGATGTMALPRSIGSLRVYRTTPNGVPIYAAVKPLAGEDGRIRFDAVVVDAKGRVYLEMDDYRTEPLPYSVEKEQLEPLQRWMKQ